MIRTDLVCFGEILWDFLPEGKVAGGAPYNIVNRASALGLKSRIISSVGRDDLGDELLERVVDKGNSIEFIQRHVTLPTGRVNVELGPEGEPSYDIVKPVAWDDIPLNPDLVDLVANSRSFVFSSLALRDKRSRSVLFTLIPHAQRKICDINLREGHYVSDTILRMMKSADILRMNEYEFARVSEWTDMANYGTEERLNKLRDLYGYEIIIVTLGKEGAISLSSQGINIQPVFPVEVVDTIGSGDAFLASYIASMLMGGSPETNLRFASAVGSLNASKPGGTPKITSEEIDRILSS